MILTFSDLINVLALITLVLMFTARSHNLKHPESIHPAYTPKGVNSIGFVIALILSVLAYNPDWGRVFESSFRVLFVGIYYLIIAGIMTLFKRKKNKSQDM